MMPQRADLLEAGPGAEASLFNVLALDKSTDASASYKARLFAAVDAFSPAPGLVTYRPEWAEAQEAANTAGGHTVNSYHSFEWKRTRPDPEALSN
jgi:hypothetical protein